MRNEHPHGSGPLSALSNSVPLTPDNRFKLLAEIGCLVAEVAETDVGRVLGRILEAACAVFQAEGGSVFLVDYPSTELILLREIGEPITEITDLHRKAGGVLFSSPEEVRAEPSIQASLSSNGRTLTSIPLRIGSNTIGNLCIVSTQPIKLEEDDETLLKALAGQAALVIDRSGYAEPSKEASHAFANIFQVSQLLRSSLEIGALHQEIANSALRVSRADLVVLYEYSEERGDVGIPPVIAGKINISEILTSRGMAGAHRSSTVFRLLAYDKPFYAPEGYEDWRAQGLIDEEVGIEHSFFQREQVLSSAGFPLRIDAERVGVLFFNYRTEVLFNRWLRERLELFSNQAALALGNGRVFQRSENYSQKLKVLQDIGRELSMAVGLGTFEILGVLDEQVRRVIPSASFFVCLYDEADDRVELPYLRDERARLEDLVPGLNKGLASYVIRTGRPLFAQYDRIEELIARNEVELVGTPAKIWLGAPMVARQKVIGVIVVQDHDDENAFDSEDLEFLCLIASQAAIAIDNHQLFTSFKLQVEELSALLKLSREMGAGRLALSSFLSSVLDQACQLARCNGSLLSIRDPGDNGRLRVIAASRDLQHMIGKTVELGYGVIGSVAVDSKPLIVGGYQAWEARANVLDEYAGVFPRQVCAVPILWRERVFGVMTLSSSTEGEFSEREVQLLQRLAGPLASAISNAYDSAFLRFLIHDSPHAIVAVDTGGRVTELSAAAERLFKYAREELIGEMVPPLYWGGLNEAKRIGIQLGQSGHFEGTLFGKTKTGEKIPLSVSASILRDQEGKSFGSMGVIEDLRLGSLRGRSRDLVRALGEINLVQELDRALELIVFHAIDLLYGDAACLFVREGETFEIRVSMGTDEECLADWDAPSAQNLIGEFVRQERVPKPLAVEELGGLRLTRRSRSAIPAPIRVAERLLALLWIESQEVGHFQEDPELLQTLVDQATQSISRLELLREREKTLQKLLTTSNAISIGEIATSFLHEIKNSFNGITLSVLDLQEGLHGEPHLSAKKEYVQQLGDVLTEMKRLDDLARRLQGFSRQRLLPTLQQAYLNEIVERTLELLKSTLRNKKLRYELRLDPALDRQVEGKGNPILVDEAQLQQVFMNLVLNAVDASPARGRLVLETRNNERHVEFRLTDQGRGISETERAKIFEAFFTTKATGTGLGLYISKILIEENHQGRIEVSSAPGKGTSFFIFIPKGS